MTNRQGETVRLSPQTWLAFWSLILALVGGLVAGAYGYHISRMEDRERFIRIEMSAQATAQTVQGIAVDVKERIGKVESRVDRLEASK